MSYLINAIDSIGANQQCAARISVFHLNSYLMGVKKAINDLGLWQEIDERITVIFEKEIFSKYGEDSSVNLSIFKASRSPAHSADLYLEEFRVCVANLGSDLIQPTKRSTNLKSINLSPMLLAFEKRPRFYFGAKDVTHLRSFIDGVQCVAAATGGALINPNIANFEQWILATSSQPGTYSWDMLLMSVCGGDCAEAYGKFFEKFREFSLK